MKVIAGSYHFHHRETLNSRGGHGEESGRDGREVARKVDYTDLYYDTEDLLLYRRAPG